MQYALWNDSLQSPDETDNDIEESLDTTWCSNDT